MSTDFFKIATVTKKNGVTEIYPKFIINNKSSDLMIKGRDFYAVWVEERGLWSTDEDDLIALVDRHIRAYYDEHKGELDRVQLMYLKDGDTCMIDKWHKYCQKQMRDSFHMLDEKLIFSNTETQKTDYASKRLSYPLEEGSIEAYDKLISTLYSPEERHKIEWAIGAIVTGDSKKLQKFMVLYGAAGTGKSTILNIIQQLFDGYCSVFDARALGSSSNSFALEAFKRNPLVAIQHDGDLSRIEDNTRLNSLVSHELMTVNEKFKPTYENDFKCFLFMGTNKPVKITDAKSGLIRRLIDVTPSGDKLSAKEYKRLTKQIKFELGAIACHCRDVYLDNPSAYDDYIPIEMMGASNDFYNFVLDAYHVFNTDDGVTLKTAWELYKAYCDEARVPYSLSQRNFKEELKNYFNEYKERVLLTDGSRARNYYSGFKIDKFENSTVKKKAETIVSELINFNCTESIFDKECAKCNAQYATTKGTPCVKWDSVTSTLSELDTTKLHYVKVPENHIVIDFDISDEQGNKDYRRNLEAASKWPATYAELSKSGAGIHLHYIYNGDVTKLSRIYDDHIEVKVFTGNSSLRRKLSKCNDLPIATISSGLPLKGEKMINFDAVKSEKGLRTLIKRNLNKEIHSGTKPSIDFIFKILDDAYKSGMCYDVSDLYSAVLSFAANSTNQSEYCVKLVSKMKFKSDENSPGENSNKTKLIFYDVEVFPNLFLVNWKFQGKGEPVVRMINPKPSEIEELIKFNLVGFNCRRYDNHMLYARLMGYSNEQLYKLSQKIINSKKGDMNNGMFGEAYNISYTDVYDYASKKQSLKKWEIELGIHHQELGLPWDQPVPEELWLKVAEYCDNDVIATEAVFDATQADFVARQIQVDIVKSLHGINTVCVNDTTNTLSKRIIFGRNRKPQNEFNWRDMSKPVGSDQYEEYREKFGEDYKFRVFDDDGLPLYRDYIPGEKLPKGYSILPFFKGYTFERGKSTYLGEEIGEGGRVHAVPGMYFNVWDGDIASQHPHSVIFEVLFGPKFTKIFEDIVKARVAVKHKDFETAGSLLNGVLKPYLNEEQAKDLAQALKIIINSIYGLTSAKFDNEFRDKRNIDNIVAKRGALFMTLLKREVEKLGYTVAHIKTDSIKIPNATQEIKDFVTKFGKEFGYSFETEAEFEKFCLVNNAVYVAKVRDGDWTATGTQFAVPYVFKKLFTHEPIEFEDLCETKEVKSALYLDMNENLPEGEHNYQFIGKVGLFCPIKPGRGGGILVREATDKNGNIKYDSATGADGYRWLEAELVKTLEKEADIDTSYYDILVDAAIYGKGSGKDYKPGISDFGDFEMFVSDEPVPEPGLNLPPWVMPCGRTTCEGCSNFNNDEYHFDCTLGHDISDLAALNKLA